MNNFGQPHLLSIGETTLHWVEGGEGPPLVLLHGLSDCHRTWRRVAPRFTARRKVFLLDLPGHGLSSRPNASYELDWHARVIAQWLDALGLDDVELVGHSYGGGVAQQLLLHRSDRIRRLGLVSSGGLGRSVPMSLRLMAIPWIESMVQPFMRIGTQLAMVSSFASPFDPLDKEFLTWANSAPGTGRALSRTVRGVIGPWGQTRGFLERAHEVSSLPPIELYWGMQDPVIPARHGRRAACLLRNVRLVQFQGCGHFPHLERPAEFASALAEFLEAERLRAYVAVPPALPRRRSWFVRATSWLGRVLRRFFRRGPQPVTSMG